MKNTFFIVGATAVGKSELAADVAANLGAEVVSADAFQVYRGLDLLTAKPEQSTLKKAPHHLIGTLGAKEEMNAEKFRRLARDVLAEIRGRAKCAIVVGGSGLYVRALTHGLARVPGPNPQVRAKLDALSLDELNARLEQLDPKLFARIDRKNRRRVSRALEICQISGRPVSDQIPGWDTGVDVPGVLVFRDREDLHARINRRVVEMLERGAVEEARNFGEAITTAAKTIGLREIHDFLAGRMSRADCVAEIQKVTRRYAKRQLTWFRHQTNFEPLNLTILSHEQAVEWITERARRSFA